MWYITKFELNLIFFKKVLEVGLEKEMSEEYNEIYTELINYNKSLLKSSFDV